MAGSLVPFLQSLLNNSVVSSFSTMLIMNKKNCSEVNELTKIIYQLPVTKYGIINCYIDII